MADVKEVLIPDIGDFSDVPVIEVLVEPGQSIQAEDPLLTLESDKATMDVPSPYTGVVEEVLVEVGSKVSEGDKVMTIAPQADEGAPDEAAAPGATESAVAAEGRESGQAADEPEPSDQHGRGEPQPRDSYAGEPSERDEAVAKIYASPSARRLAREKGVDLSALEGSGRGGRITLEDVEKAAEGGVPAGRGAPAPSAGGPALEGLPPWPDVDFSKFGEIETVELPRIKRISGPNVARNWIVIPHVTQFDEADITDLEAFRKRINAEQDVKVTMVALLVKACVATLKAFPDFNASLAGDKLVLKKYFHIGFAADTPGGLLVPVIRDADRKGLLEIAAELRDLSGRARDGKLKADEMRGGTFSISSLGGIGGTAFTPIINAPEVAILGVSRSVMKPVWDGEQFAPRLVLPLSLSYDHRVIDGAAAARFTTHLAGVLSDMRRVLL